MVDGDVQFVPLYGAETEEAILERWAGWANEGLDPAENEADWTDTREGSHWWVATTPPRREFARIYDLAGSEVLAAAFPQWAWGEYLDDHAELRNIFRLAATPSTGEVTFTGPEGTVIEVGTVVSTEPSLPGDAPVEAEVTAGGTIGPEEELTLPVRAREAGAHTNVPEGGIVLLVTPVDGDPEVTNTTPLVGGTDTQTDLVLRDRTLEAYGVPAVANAAFYRQLALRQDGVGRVTVIRAAYGPGTIALIVATADGRPVSREVVAALQAAVDPIAGQGAGQGQVGAEITVSTSALLLVDVDVTIEFAAGYSADGAAGTVALEEPIAEAIAAYIDTVPTGGEVVRQKIVGAIVGVAGVHDVGNLRLNGVAGNVTVSDDPPEAPALGDLTITAAPV